MQNICFTIVLASSLVLSQTANARIDVTTLNENPPIAWQNKIQATVENIIKTESEDLAGDYELSLGVFEKEKQIQLVIELKAANNESYRQERVASFASTLAQARAMTRTVLKHARTAEQQLKPNTTEADSQTDPAKANSTDKKSAINDLGFLVAGTYLDQFGFAAGARIDSLWMIKGEIALGFRLKIEATNLVISGTDGNPWYGECGKQSDAEDLCHESRYWFISPSISFLGGVFVSQVFSIKFNLGVDFFMAPQWGLNSVIPHPNLGMTTSFEIARTRKVALLFTQTLDVTIIVDTIGPLFNLGIGLELRY